MEECVMKPRVAERTKIERALQEKKAVGCYRYSEEPFRIRRKDFWPLPKAGKLLQDFIPALSHECDGLILQVAPECESAGFATHISSLDPRQTNVMCRTLHL